MTDRTFRHLADMATSPAEKEWLNQQADDYGEPKETNVEQWTPEQVKDARTKLRLTQEGLARALGLRGPYAKDTVRGWESGKRPINGPAQIAMSFMLGGSHAPTD